MFTTVAVVYIAAKHDMEVSGLGPLIVDFFAWMALAEILTSGCF